MADGDTGKIEKAAQEEIDKLNAALEKEKQRVANAEEKINSWGNEIGDLRKERESLKTTLKDAQELIESLKKNVVSNDSTTKTVKGDVTEEKPDEVANTVEKSLNDGQRKAGEIAFNALNDAEKIQYENDAKFRLSFLTRLQEVAPVIPSSPWG